MLNDVRLWLELLKGATRDAIVFIAIVLLMTIVFSSIYQYLKWKAETVRSED